VLDTSTPNLARACDYLLGGGASFAADRALALRLAAFYPGMRDVLFSSRTYAADSIARIASDGVDQYLDLGSGLPTRSATHETVLALRPGARVVYVDRDPAVTEHGRALVPASVRCVAGDLAEPETILASGEIDGFLDFSRPVCLVLTLVLHVLDPGTARAVAGVLVRALPAGSYLVATVGAGKAGELPGSVRPGGFTADDFASFFAGLDLVPPGIGTGPRAAGPGLGAGGADGPGGKILCATGRKPPAGLRR
jgi:SAM-dependent methyltransferase